MASRTPQRPLIGINSDYYEPKIGSAFARVNDGYFDSILNAGGLPILLPPMRKENFPELNALLDMVTGVVMVGGMDLDPRRMGRQLTNAVQPMAVRREESDRYLLDQVFQRKLPLIAIGTGMQLLNVYFGGTLFDHLPLDCPKAMPHYDQAGGVHRHMVSVEKNSLLKDIFGADELRVNSMHHQGINQVGRRLRVGAKAPDGIIEAIESTDESWFCLGTQWHPECQSASALDVQLFHNLVEQAMKFSDVAPARRLVAA